MQVFKWIAVLVLVATVPAMAIQVGTTWSEDGDAGELPGSAQDVSGSGLLTEINGYLEDLGGAAPDDIDMYLIDIFDVDAFSVGTSANLTGDNDMMLFVHTYQGHQAIADDDGGSGLLPLIYAGELSGYASGLYYLTADLYATQPADDPITGWVRNPAPFQTGPYTLTLTGARFTTAQAVPDPGATGLLLSAALVAMAGLRRRLL